MTKSINTENAKTFDTIIFKPKKDGIGAIAERATLVFSDSEPAFETFANAIDAEYIDCTERTIICEDKKGGLAFQDVCIICDDEGLLIENPKPSVANVITGRVELCGAVLLAKSAKDAVNSEHFEPLDSETLDLIWKSYSPKRSVAPLMLYVK